VTQHEKCIVGTVLVDSLIYRI